MTAYQVLPGLTSEEYADLRGDIEANGIRVPVDVDENGQVLDGHHRSLIAAELGIDCPRRTVAGLTEDQKLAHALAVNIHRRTLTREQRRELLAASIKSAPELSDREHARRVGASDKTAGVVRDALEATAEIPQSATRVSRDGRERPATQPPRSIKVETTTTEYVDPETGVMLSAEEWQEQNPPRDPIAEARREALSEPVMVAAKGIAYLTRARQAFAAAGTPGDIAADFLPEDEAVRDSFVTELDKSAAVIADLLRAIRRTTLRSVKP